LPLSLAFPGETEVFIALTDGTNVTLTELVNALGDLAETRVDLSQTKTQLKGTQDDLAASNNLLAATISRVSSLEGR
jgi:hypothetical protein